MFLSVAFLYGVHLLGVKMLSLMDEVELIGAILKAYLLSAIFLCLLFMLIFSNIINSLSSLFLSEDLDLPLASPLSIFSIYISRFTEVMIKSSWMVIILLIPIMTAYAANYHSPWFFHLIWPFLILPFLSLCTGTGMIIGCIMAATFPVKRTATAMKAIFVIGIGISIIILRLLQPEQLVVPEKFYDFGRFLMSLHSPAATSLPGYYLSKIIISFLQMDFFHLSSLSVKYLVLPLILTTASWFVFKKLFIKGWRKMQISPAADLTEKTNLNNPMNHQRHLNQSFLEKVIEKTGKILKLTCGETVILKKEVLIFLRTPALWIQTAMIFVIILIYIYNIQLLPAKSLASLKAELPSITAFCNIAFITFIVTAAALRFGFPSVSMERNALALILASPCSDKNYIKVKFLASALPLMLLALLLSTTSSYLFESATLVTITVILDTLLLAVTITSFALMFGVIYGNLNSADFTEIPSGFGGMIFMIWSSVFTIVFLGLQAYPFYMHFLTTSSIYVMNAPEKVTVVMAMISSIALCFTSLYFSMKKAVKNLGDLI